MPEDVRLSKRVAFVLRHAPESVGLELGAGGWVSVQDLAAALSVEPSALQELAAHSSKQRFAIVGDRVRAQQGHSVQVDLELATARPPAALWHGAAERFLPAIGFHHKSVARRHR